MNSPDQKNLTNEARVPLAFVATGSVVILVELGNAIDSMLREQLTSYGLTPNRSISVLQQRPMTVILADEVELALEHKVARQIWVEPAPVTRNGN
jgi:Fe2+ transport system protein FeoA